MRISLQSAIISHVGLTGLSLSLAMSGVGCGKDGDKKKPEQAAAAKTLEVANTVVPPDVIHLSFLDDPGFRVPLKAMSKFESLNRLLPLEMRSAGAWASLELTMADGSERVLEAPREVYGEAEYDLRAAAAGKPGMVLVVLDKQSQVVRARFGPLAKIHVTPTEDSIPKPQPFPISFNGKESIVTPDQLSLVPTVAAPVNERDAWILTTVIKGLRPHCKVVGASVSSATESLEVSAAQLNDGYLRYNRRGLLMFSLVKAENIAGRKRIRDVVRVDVDCGAR